MNDLEALQQASERRKFLAPFKAPAARKKTPYIRVGFVLVGLIVFGSVGWRLYEKIKPITPVTPKAKIAIFGAPNGEAFIIANRDDVPITLESFIVNGHFRLQEKHVIPPGNRCDIPCLALEDDAGRKFVPNKFTQGYRGISIICVADGRTNFEYIGKPLPPPPPKSYDPANDPALDYLRD